MAKYLLQELNFGLQLIKKQESPNERYIGIDAVLPIINDISRFNPDYNKDEDGNPKPQPGISIESVVEGIKIYGKLDGAGLIYPIRLQRVFPTKDGIGSLTGLSEPQYQDIFLKKPDQTSVLYIIHYQEERGVLIMTGARRPLYVSPYIGVREILREARQLIWTNSNSNKR